MSQKDIVRAWKDEEFRNSLSDAERALLPTHPAGLLELTDEALDDLLAYGGVSPFDSCGFLSCNKTSAAAVDTII
jgi:mersacidin/lichenicidin family type 2 lantibiotic